MPVLLRSTTLAALALASALVAAHDGAVDAGGCHHDATGHHCHRDIARQAQLARHSAVDRPGSSAEDAPGGWSHRDCTTAMPACGSVGTAAPAAGPSNAMTEALEQQPREWTQRFGTGALGLLILAVLSVLSLHATGAAQAPRTRHRS